MTKLPIVESYWVEADRLLAGEYPGNHDPESTRRRMDAFLEAGVSAFVNLTEAHELPPYEDILKEQAKLSGLEITHQRLSIPDFGISSAQTMSAILDAIDEAIHNGRRVYVHCWAGIGRTGLVVGCYLVRHGMSGEQALERVNQLYRTRPLKPRYPYSPQTEEQMDFVRNWQDACHLSD